MSYYLASCIGFTFILKYGSILKDYRARVTKDNELLQDLFKCSLCLGFWAGVLHIPFVALSEWALQIKYLALPFISAAVCWSADSLVQMIQAVDVYLMSRKQTPIDSPSDSITSSKL